MLWWALFISMFEKMDVESGNIVAGHFIMNHILKC